MKPMANLLEKLKSIDINSLSKINVNLDVKSLEECFRKRTDILINVIVVVLAIGLSYYFYTSANAKTAMINQELTTLGEKQTAAIELEGQKTKLNNFTKATPQGFAAETEIIKKVVELAESKNITVVFYTPTASQNEKFYLIQTVDFIFESSFAQMIDLLRAIEENKENLRIVFWKNENSNQEREGFGNKKKVIDENIIKWKISVTSTLLNDEK